MIKFTTFLQDDLQPIAHKTTSLGADVAPSVPVGEKALIGRHSPFGEPIQLQAFDFVIDGQLVPEPLEGDPS